MEILEPKRNLFPKINLKSKGEISLNKILNGRDAFVPYDLMTRGMPRSKIARGVLYREDMDAFGRTIFTKVNENTVVLGGAIAALERLSGVESSFHPNTLNDILNINPGYAYNLLNTPIALFGCGNGGAGLDFGNVYAPDVKQNNISGLLPMMVSQTSPVGSDADKYAMKSTISTPDGTQLNCWYLKEFDTEPIIRSLWKDAASEDEDGTEITADISDSESENGVESFVQFKLVLNDDDVRSYYEAMGMLSQARFNSVGLYLGEKNDVLGDYVNVSLMSVVNINNEALAERKTITYYYRLYTMI